MKAENIHHPISSGLPNAFTNGRSLLHPSMHAAVQMSAHAGRIDVPQNMLSAQSLNMGMIQGINGGMIKSESGYSGSSPYMFDSDGNVPEVRPTIGDASGASFTSVESNSQALTEPILDADSTSFGFLTQIPRSFSLSDLTADFSQSSGLSSLSICLFVCARARACLHLCTLLALFLLENTVLVNEAPGFSSWLSKTIWLICLS